MKITVITVTYNSAATVVDTLRSVAAQTHADIEHLIIDGGSTDDTLALVQSHGPHVARVVSERDQGIYDAMNKGLALATGEVVGFLNSDDIFADTLVIERVAKAMRVPGVDACYGDLAFVDQDNLSRVIRYWRPGAHLKGACARGWVPPHPTFYARRRAYEQHGGFDLAFPMAGDFEMGLRLLDVAGLNAVYIPALLVRMRTGGASNGGLSSVIRNNRETSRACVKHGFPGGVKFLASRFLYKVPELFRRRT